MYQRPILRNEEGASPGGGAPAPASPAAPSGAAPASPFSIDDIKAAVRATVADEFKTQSDGFFASARKAGLLDKGGKPSPTAPTSAPAPVEQPAAPGVTGMTAAEVQAIVARERAFERATASAGLTAEQVAIVEQTFRAVNPSDPFEWTNTFIKTLGIGQKPQPATPQAPAEQPAAPTPAAPAGPSFSDKGPAAASAARDPMAIIQHDPRKATLSDFHRLVASEGEAKALRSWTDHTMRFLSTLKVRPEGRR